VSLQRVQQYDQALKVFNEVLSIRPENVQARNNAGVVYKALGDTETARKYFQESLDQDPGYTRAAVNLTEISEQEGDFDSAAALLRPYAEKEPGNHEVQIRLARFLMESGKPTEALERVRTVLSRDPDSVQAHIVLGTLYQKTGKSGKAEEEYRKALEIDRTNAEARMKLARLYAERQEFEKSIAELSYILQTRPVDRDARKLLGELYLKQNLYQEALGLFSDLYREKTNDEDVLRCLIHVYRALGDTEKALSLAEELINIEQQKGSRLDLDKLEATLDMYEEVAGEYAEDYEELWKRNIERIEQEEPEILGEGGERSEEESLFFEDFPDLEGEVVPIIDIGGIEPVIGIQEEEEKISLTELEEDIDIPEPVPEKEEPEPVMMSEPLPDYPRPPAASGPQPGVSPQNEALRASEGDQLKGMPQGRQSPLPQGFSGRIEISSNLFSKPIPLQIEITEKPPSAEPEPQKEEPEAAEPEEEMPEEEVSPEPEEGPRRPAKPEDLFGYLEGLASYLPPDKREQFVASEMPLKLASIRNRLAGKEGLRKKIEQDIGAAIEKPAEVSASPPITPGRVQKTLSFMEDMSGYLPEEDVRLALKAKISHILNSLKD
jgi:tetratricopeptide (TPR) repeat protein